MITREINGKDYTLNFDMMAALRFENATGRSLFELARDVGKTATMVKDLMSGKGDPTEEAPYKLADLIAVVKAGCQEITDSDLNHAADKKLKAFEFEMLTWIINEMVDSGIMAKAPEKPQESGKRPVGNGRKKPKTSGTSTKKKLTDT